MFDHLSLPVADLARSAAFYEAVLAPLGHVELDSNARSVVYGPPSHTGEPPFALIQSTVHAPAPAREFHIAFSAESRRAVQRFHAAALAAGGRDDGPPGIREHYDPGYYAAFVTDPDGNRIEAVLHER